MRVLMISKALVAGTSQRKLEEIAKCPNLELTVAVPPYWLSDDGSKQMLERFYTDGYRMLVTPIAFNGKFHWHYYPQLQQIMQDVQPDIVHMDEEPYNLATLQAIHLAKKHHAKALFFTWQNLHRNYPPPFRQIELYNYKHASMAIAGNRDASEVLRSKGYQGPMRIIPQFGFDTDIYKRSNPRTPRASNAPFTLGFIGRLKEEKGLPLMLEALTYLPDYCQVIFIGHGPMKSPLEEQAARLGVSQRVQFRPSIPTDQVPTAMENLDAFVLPSISRPNWTEQFGRVLAESMSCETPVIGSSCGEIPYVIGDAGLVFKEGDAHELAVCVQKLLNDPQLYATLAHRGRQRVLENYTQGQIARHTYEAYRDMLL